MASKKGVGADVKAADVQIAHERLTEFVRANRKKKLHLEEVQAEYTQLAATLQDLPQKLSHPIMVPFAGVAFMKGQIVHPNEVTVLLGDNWFVQCTASHAVGIVERRQKRSFAETFDDVIDVEKSLQDLESEFNLVKGKLGLSNELNLSQDENGFIEIREPVTEESDTIRIPPSGTATKVPPAPPKIQVLSETPGFNEEDLYRVPEGLDEEDYEEEEEEEEFPLDDFDDDEIAASLATAARSAQKNQPTTSQLPIKSPSSSQQGVAPSRTALPTIGKKSADPASNAPGKERHKPERVVIQASSSKPVTLPTFKKSTPSSAGSSNASPIAVVEKDVVAPPMAPGLAVTENTSANSGSEQEPKRVSRFKQMHGK